ncbi:E3 ubiquitin-protein ligase TRIM56-like [Haliotis rubra]|uniref:E3 ubiquitin-protein ligase TRIM56-like n=1 Tax=Haliotis rubra TaxID=36100 RepID=UPI001EE53F8F|nr:E3 ubiquitin-protein ligase TRIM56-like [Haliotis rubra]
MATSKKLTEHFLTCTICTEVFDKPCSLVCNHTFCRKCVVDYTKTRREALSAKSLLCPFCRRTTEVSDPERPVEEWADDIKPSFVIQGLMDSFGPGSKDTTNCSYCKEEGETTPATSWCSVCDDVLCERCTRMHQRIPSTRHHDVVDLSGETKVKVKRNVMCKVHKNKSIKYLCKDCKTAVCQACCTIHHRKCELVVEIESEIPAMKTELKRNRGNVLKMQDEVKTHLENLNSKVKEEMGIHLQLESNIKTASLTVIEVIKVKERKLLSELKEMSDRHIGQLKGCEAGDVEAVGVVEVKEKGRIDRITFRQDTDKLSRALEHLHLGEILVQYDDVLGLKATPVLQDTITVLDLKATPVLLDTINVLDLKATPVLQDTIDVKVAGDTDSVFSTDITMFVVNGTNTVVVTDCNNNSVKSFYTRNSHAAQSKLSLGCKPYGIARIHDNQVAVTVLDIGQIVTVKVNPDLVLLSTITTSKQYWGFSTISKRCI